MTHSPVSAFQLVPDVYKLRPKKSLLDMTYQQENHPPFKNGGMLKEYQWEAVRWMCANWSHSRGCILADEVRSNGEHLSG